MISATFKCVWRRGHARLVHLGVKRSSSSATVFLACSPHADLDGVERGNEGRQKKNDSWSFTLYFSSFLFWLFFFHAHSLSSFRCGFSVVVVVVVVVVARSVVVRFLIVALVALVLFCSSLSLSLYRYIHIYNRPSTRFVSHVHSIDALFTEFFFFLFSLPLCALQVKRCTAASTVVSEGAVPFVAFPLSLPISAPWLCSASAFPAHQRCVLAVYDVWLPCFLLHVLCACPYTQGSLFHLKVPAPGKGDRARAWRCGSSARLGVVARSTSLLPYGASSAVAVLAYLSLCSSDSLYRPLRHTSEKAGQERGVAKGSRIASVRLCTACLRPSFDVCAFFSV